MCYDKGNYAELNKEVANIKWKEIINPTDHIDRNWGKLYSELMEKRYIPSRNIKSSNKKKRSDLPMDRIKQKNALKRKCMNNSDPNTRAEYNRVRNQVKTLKKKLKKKHEKNLAKSAKKNSKAIWKYIKRLVMTRKNQKFWRSSFRVSFQKNQMTRLLSSH
jgi:hypothetical protein